MSSARRLEYLAIALGVVGAGLMLAFDVTVTRVAGVAALLGFVGVGLFAVANPGYLSAGEDEAPDDAEGRV